MQRKLDEKEGRTIGSGLVTSWVLAAMILIMSTFFAQLEPGTGQQETVSLR